VSEEMTDGQVPRGSLVHIGLCVPDLDHGVAWYRDVLGFEVLAGPTELTADAGEEGAAAADVFGPDFRRVRMAHLIGANGAALEMFEFVEPRQEPRADGFHPLRVGVSHLCVLALEIEETAARIVATGGRQTTAIWATIPGKPYRFVWCEDPFGNAVELYSHPHGEVFGGADR
jgi:catechol 2,3-dioxygenase-like lactoylglutathione lyase family enzyme